MSYGYVFMCLVVGSCFERSQRKLPRFLIIALCKPMLACPRLQTNVVTPAEPGVALENRFGFAETQQCVLTLPCMVIVNAEVNKRVGLGLKHVMFTPHFQTTLIIFEGTIKVLQLAMNPANAVWEPRQPEPITIPLAHFNCFVQGSQGL